MSELDRELIVSVARNLLDRIASGDLEGMLRLMSPSVVCFPETDWGYARYSRPIVGKEAAREAFRQRHINYVCLEHAVHRLLVDGEVAAIHRSVALQGRGGGKIYAFDAVNFVRVRDGLVMEYSELPDGGAYGAVVNFPH